MKVVVDTSIVICALLHPTRSCGQIMDQILDGHIDWTVTPPIIAEYKEVISRSEFPVSDYHRKWLLEELNNLPTLPAPPFNCTSIKCSDKDAQHFLNAAIYYRASFLITGNLKHYPRKSVLGLKIVSPNNWLKIGE